MEKEEDADTETQELLLSLLDVRCPSAAAAAVAAAAAAAAAAMSPAQSRSPLASPQLSGGGAFPDLTEAASPSRPSTHGRDSSSGGTGSAAVVDVPAPGQNDAQGRRASGSEAAAHRLSGGGGGGGGGRSGAAEERPTPRLPGGVPLAGGSRRPSDASAAAAGGTVAGPGASVGTAWGAGEAGPGAAAVSPPPASAAALVAATAPASRTSANGSASASTSVSRQASGRKVSASGSGSGSQMQQQPHQSPSKGPLDSAEAAQAGAGARASHGPPPGVGTSSHRPPLPPGHHAPPAHSSSSAAPTAGAAGSRTPATRRVSGASSNGDTGAGGGGGAAAAEAGDDQLRERRASGSAAGPASTPSPSVSVSDPKLRPPSGSGHGQAGPSSGRTSGAGGAVPGPGPSLPTVGELRPLRTGSGRQLPPAAAAGLAQQAPPGASSSSSAAPSARAGAGAGHSQIASSPAALASGGGGGGRAVRFSSADDDDASLGVAAGSAPQGGLPPVRRPSDGAPLPPHGTLHLPPPLESPGGAGAGVEPGGVAVGAVSPLNRGASSRTTSNNGTGPAGVPGSAGPFADDVLQPSRRPGPSRAASNDLRQANSWSDLAPPPLSHMNINRQPSGDGGAAAGAGRTSASGTPAGGTAPQPLSPEGGQAGGSGRAVLANSGGGAGAGAASAGPHAIRRAVELSPLTAAAAAVGVGGGGGGPGAEAALREALAKQAVANAAALTAALNTDGGSDSVLRPWSAGSSHNALGGGGGGGGGGHGGHGGVVESDFGYARIVAQHTGLVVGAAGTGAGGASPLAGGAGGLRSLQAGLGSSGRRLALAPLPVLPSLPTGSAAGGIPDLPQPLPLPGALLSPSGGGTEGPGSGGPAGGGGGGGGGRHVAISSDGTQPQHRHDAGGSSAPASPKGRAAAAAASGGPVSPLPSRPPLGSAPGVGVGARSFKSALKGSAGNGLANSGALPPVEQHLAGAPTFAADGGGGGGGGGASGMPLPGLPRAGQALPQRRVSGSSAAAAAAAASGADSGVDSPSVLARLMMTGSGAGAAGAAGGAGGGPGSSGGPGSAALLGYGGVGGGADVDLDGMPPLDLSHAESVDVRIHCLTFNMGGVTPPAAALPETLFSGSCLGPGDVPLAGAGGGGGGDLLGGGGGGGGDDGGGSMGAGAAGDGADLYVFSSQESGPLSEWEAAVSAHLGRRYVRVAAESLMAIHILLFAARPLAPHIKEVRTSSVATGVGNVLGNKGGVAVTFSLAGAQVLLVGAHFAAHDAYVERRNADFHRICAGLFSAPPAAAAAATAAGPPPNASANSNGNGPGSAATARPSADFARSSAGTVVGSGHPSHVHPGTGAGGGGGGYASTPESRSNTPGRPPRGGGGGGGGFTAGGPTLSRFSRGFGLGSRDNGSGAAGAGGGGGPPSAAPTESGADEGGGRGGAARSGPSRALSRQLSSESNSSVMSGVSHYHGGGGGVTSRAPSVSGGTRSRAASFFSGMSFATAARTSTALLAHFDVVLWMGDLNYRIAGNPEVVKFAIDNNMVEVLAANDQLRNQQKKGKVLQGFHEMPIAFAPTFKFTPGTDAYDLKRTPAWTDRVLYAVHADPLFADLKPLYYMSVPELRSSDHKPVIAGFELSISPQHANAGRHAKRAGCSIM